MTILPLLRTMNTMSNTRIDNERAASIYGLRAIDSGLYFYVGSTEKSPLVRLSTHLRDVVNGRHKNKHFVNKVKKLGFDNIACDVLALTDKVNRWDVEKYWIVNLIESGHKLVNRIHNDIQYKITNGKLSREEYEQLKQILENKVAPINEFELELCNTIKAGLDFLGKSGNLLEDYFNGNN